MSPFGSLIAGLVSPQWMTTADQVTSATLYLAIITTGCSAIAPFIPSKPPTPPTIAIEERPKTNVLKEFKALCRIPEFWLLTVGFTVLMGVANCFSRIQWLLMAPYGLSDVNVGLTGALPLAVVLIFSLIIANVADRTGKHLLILKVFVVCTFVFLLIFNWAPRTRNLGFVLAMACLLAMAGIGVASVFNAYVAEVLHPFGPELCISLAWSGTEILGAVMIIGASYLHDSNGLYQPAMYLVIGICFIAVPCFLILGLFGRKDAVALKKTRREDVLEDAVVEQRAAAGEV